MQLANIAWPLVFAIAGALVWAFATSNAKVAKMGEWTFVVGMLWLCYSLSHAQLHF